MLSRGIWFSAPSFWMGGGLESRCVGCGQCRARHCPQRNAATPLMVALFPSHSDITRFRPWLPITTGNHLDRAEKIPKFAQTTGTTDFLILVQAFRHPLRGKLPHVQISMDDGPNSLT